VEGRVLAEVVEELALLEVEGVLDLLVVEPLV